MNRHEAESKKRGRNRCNNQEEKRSRLPSPPPLYPYARTSHIVRDQKHHHYHPDLRTTSRHSGVHVDRVFYAISTAHTPSSSR